MSLAHILAGAGTGALAGSVVPGLGTVAGAIAGGVAGAVLAPKPPLTIVPPRNAAPSASAAADLVNSIISSVPAAPGGMPATPSTRVTIPAGVLALPPFTPAPIGTAASAGAQADLVNTMINVGARPRNYFGPRVGPGGVQPRGYGGYGDLGPVPMWLVVVGLGTLAYAAWRG